VIFRKYDSFRALFLLVSAALIAGEVAKPDFQVDPHATKEVSTVEVVPGRTSPWSFTFEPYGWTLGLYGEVGLHGVNRATHGRGAA
jgi:hypothetical protein